MNTRSQNKGQGQAAVLASWRKEKEKKRSAWQLKCKTRVGAAQGVRCCGGVLCVFCGMPRMLWATACTIRQTQVQGKRGRWGDRLTQVGDAGNGQNEEAAGAASGASRDQKV